MRTLLLVLLLLPATALAQFEDNPQQQTLWDSMNNAAPSYEMLLACERDVTADIVFDTVKEMMSLMVKTNSDIEIAFEMWSRARSNAAIEYFETLKGMEQNPNSPVCDKLENNVIQAMGRGI